MGQRKGSDTLTRRAPPFIYEYTMAKRFFCSLLLLAVVGCSSRLIDETPPGDTLAEGSLLRHAILSAGESAIDFAQRAEEKKQGTPKKRKQCRSYSILDTIIVEDRPEDEDEDEKKEDATEDESQQQDGNEEEEEDSLFSDFFGLGDDEEEILEEPIVIESLSQESTSEALSRQVEAYLEAEREITENPGEAWKESWVISACGRLTRVEVRFVPDGKGGTLVHIPFEAIVIYNAE